MCVLCFNSTKNWGVRLSLLGASALRRKKGAYSCRDGYNSPSSVTYKRPSLSSLTFRAVMVTWNLSRSR